MNTTISARATVRRFFTSGFTAADIAEYLISYDAERKADVVRQRMVEQDFDVVGVRDDGFVVGYVECDDLTGGSAADHLHYFGSDEIIADDTPLRDIVSALADRSRLFVTMLGGVGGIITRADLQKPPVRMWLFGVVTILEHTFDAILRARFADDSWQEHISEGRLASARAFQEERRRRNQALDLVSCLQFSDKAYILFKEPEIRQQFGFDSRKAARDAMSNAQNLRNNLAHGQDVVAENWETIVNASSNLDLVLSLYGG